MSTLGNPVSAEVAIQYIQSFCSHNTVEQSASKLSTPSDLKRVLYMYTVFPLAFALAT
jgi:hypothetical protein